MCGYAAISHSNLLTPVQGTVLWHRKHDGGGLLDDLRHRPDRRVQLAEAHTHLVSHSQAARMFEQHPWRHGGPLRKATSKQ